MALSDSDLSELLDALRVGDGTDLVRELAQWALAQLIDAEAVEKIGAGRYERCEERVTHRNGTRSKIAISPTPRDPKATKSQPPRPDPRIQAPPPLLSRASSSDGHLCAALWRMRALVQRVESASVTVRDADTATEVGRIGSGLAVLVGATHGDTSADADKLADKVWNLRVFPDAAGAMNRSLADRGTSDGSAEVLVVSQFTLYGDTRKGRRPSFVAAAAPEVAEPLVERMVAALAGLGATVATGRFRADMAVALVNDGPVTLMLEVPPSGTSRE